MGIKNLWSLNIDELLVADQIKHLFDKQKYEIFFPLNAQMKDIDLLFLNLDTYNSKSLQIKGSRTYTPLKSEFKKFGSGSAAWFKLDSKSIFKSTHKVDYYIFVLHSLLDGVLKKQIKIDYLIMPTEDFKNVCQNKQIRSGDFYHFFIWIDPNDRRAFDFNNKAGLIIDLSEYLNNWSLLK